MRVSLPIGGMSRGTNTHNRTVVTNRKAHTLEPVQQGCLFGIVAIIIALVSSPDPQTNQFFHKKLKPKKRQ